MEENIPEMETNEKHKTHRLKVFQDIGNGGTPPGESKEKIAGIENSTTLTNTEDHFSLSVHDEISNGNAFASEGERKATEENKLQQTKIACSFSIKASDTIKITSVEYSKLPALQQALTKFGAIKSFNTSLIGKGILIVSYFNVNDTKKAFKSLLDTNGASVSYEYEADSGKDFLPSIHESNESNKSDKSEESNSDTEKRSPKDETKPVINLEGTENTNKEEIKADALLEEKAALIAQEYGLLEEPRSMTSGNSTFDYKAKPTIKPKWELQVPSPEQEDINLNKTMPIPHHFLLSSQSPSSFNSTMHMQAQILESESSIDNDTINEESKVNYPRTVIPRAFPMQYVQQSHSPVLRTESTAYVDSEEAQLSARFEREVLFTSEGKEYPEMQREYQPYPYNPEAYYSSNPQLLRTQPIREVTPTVPMHTHTRSYDFNPSQYPIPHYMVQSLYPNPYYQGMYCEGGEDWYSDPNYYQPSSNLMYPNPPSDWKSTRRRNPEKEEDVTKFEISLENILNKKDTRTTIMIRNIPNKYNQKMLLDEIDEKHKKQYDFFYLPIDFSNKCNVGYAFINFTSPIYIPKFYEAFNGRKWDKFNSEKICHLTFGRIQGKLALQGHFQTSSIMNQQNKKVKPLILAVLPPSKDSLVEYEKSLKKEMTPEKLHELERINMAFFGAKQ